ncbi:MAG: penicillin-binding protein 2 [Cardiobacteriaceae bacterium]|nr:penicillin-binding protein 2 [Cardiobacteriaceae bacterium]
MARSASRYGAAQRQRIVLGFLGLCALGLVANLVRLQVGGTSEFLEEQGMNRFLRVQREDALRGMIMDREGEPLAISTPVSALWANPQMLWATLQGDFDRLHEKCQQDAKADERCAWMSGKSDAEKAEALLHFQRERLAPVAEILGMPLEELYDALKTRESRKFYYLKRQISPVEVDEIMALNIAGLEREDSYQRFYPAGEVVGQIVGFTGIDEKGQEGIELVYDQWLAGQVGRVRIMRDKSGNAIQVVDEEMPASPGSPLQLSIDKRIQYIMHQVLSETLAEFRAASVSGVMVDVKSGEILAMVSLPAGNPNNSAERVPELMKNHIITDVFEPGSTIKPLAMAAALDHGIITPKTQFKTNLTYPMGKNVVRDVHYYGTQDAIGVIRKSSNVGMAILSQKMPRQQYYEFLKKLGFGGYSGVRFPGEQPGVLRNPKKLNDFEYATTTFGYGISTTALQVAHAYATVANGGVRLPLSLLKVDRPGDGVRVMSEKTAKQVTEMLAAATGQGGTGTRANTESYTVAGKTGTSHKIINGRYAEKRYRSLFAGFAPVNDPRIAMVIVVDDPVPQGKNYYGGLTAAPPFGRIAEWSLKMLGVLPDKIAKTEQVELDVDPALFEDNDSEVPFASQ